MPKKMTKKEIEARRAYMREWKQKHPDKQKEYSKRYWVKKAQEGLASDEDADIQRAIFANALEQIRLSQEEILKALKLITDILK